MGTPFMQSEFPLPPAFPKRPFYIVTNFPPQLIQPVAPALYWREEESRINRGAWNKKVPNGAMHARTHRLCVLDGVKRRQIGWVARSSWICLLVLRRLSRVVIKQRRGIGVIWRKVKVHATTYVDHSELARSREDHGGHQVTVDAALWLLPFLCTTHTHTHFLLPQLASLATGWWVTR
jgi:hypothetical protein